MRQFNRKLAIIRAMCIEHHLTLVSNNDNYIDMSSLVCVLSLCRFEIGLPISKCDIDQQSYYMNRNDYEVYVNLE